VNLPKGRKIIKNRWVFDLKGDRRKKARLVAKDFSQVEGIDFNEIFSPVVRFETIRLMLTLAALEHWHITSVDVKTVFLYGELDEELYMEQPEGFKTKGQEHKVLHLKRAIYGLRQAALQWWKALDKSMASIGLKRLQSDSGIFVYKDKGDLVIAVVYVDDALFLGSNLPLVNRLKSLFINKWECRDLGETKEFLCMCIIRKQGMIFLDQTAYLQKVLQRFQMVNVRAAITPLPAGYNPVPNPDPYDADTCHKFQQVIGSLLYIMLSTCPDIAYAVTKLLQYVANPSKDH
jgi:Reverse transcriptase (RNA-dependent DNA polymerase)